MAFASASTFILQQAGLSATPLLIAGYGELIAQRAGVINVGIEGAMLTGAFAGYAAAIVTGSVSSAIPAAMLAGMCMAALFALVVVWFRADQIVAGTALNILAAGITTTALRRLDVYATTHAIPPMYDPLAATYLSGLPFIGPALSQIFSQYALFYWSIPIAIALFCLMKFSRVGLVIRGLGDAPDACNAAGINVRLMRTLLLLLAGALSGLAGAYLSTMRIHTFQINMTSGRGYLVLALVIFGRWNLPGFIAGVLAFSILDGFKSFLATSSNAGALAHLLEMLPYLATLLALAVMARSRAGPIHLGRPWPE